MTKYAAFAFATDVRATALRQALDETVLNVEHSGGDLNTLRLVSVGSDGNGQASIYFTYEPVVSGQE